ncbi:phosphatase PAP2 family protein [Zunongwangia sp. H14]|uniref:phosphatase PAP2 family protein n=1 Tax=Zunongwangia sp. H14 TaxID=3240792 RepID=UPI0035672BFC
MHRYLTVLLVFFICFSLSAQNGTSPYKTDFWKDGAWVTGGVGLNVLGVLMIQNKDNLSTADLEALNREDIWAVDRWAAGNYSKSADELSYIPFYGSFALPLLFLSSRNERNNFGQISVLFIETMATTGAMFTITAALVEKSRPLVYNKGLSEEDRLDSDAQRSFFAGHTAATAAATFFAAKVFQDFNPDSAALPYIWTGAAAIPAFVGYLRIDAGKHFLTDNLIGLGIGAACGILIPQLHKKENKNLEVYPTVQFNINGSGMNSRGLGISYRF